MAETGVPASGPTGPACYLRVRYARRMTPQRVYPVRVELEKAPALNSAKREPQGAVRLRLEVPGALVAPAERELDAGAAGAAAVFHLTPLAFGELPGAKLHYEPPGQPPQVMALPMQGVSQRKTWVLALLFVLVPAALFAARGKTQWATPPDGSAPGGWEQRLQLFLPQSTPLRGALIATSQAAVDLVVLKGGTYKLPFVAAGLLLVLTGWSWLRNRPALGALSGPSFRMPAAGSGEPAARGVPPSLRPVDPRELNLRGKAG
ncbi:MAG TPA: hypothetical protein VIL46_15970 [Gemmataceae bacterium]